MNIERAQEITGHVFKDRAVIRAALTHPSVSALTGAENYDRLEFLGDSILGAVVSERLFSLYPESDAGELTNMRKAIVSKEPISRLTAALELLKCSDCEMHIPLNAKRVCDIYEAVIGALCVDGGIGVAREFVLKTAGDAIASHPDFRDYKSEVNELVPHYEYNVLSASEDEVKVGLIAMGRRIATGVGASKKLAERDCARNAVNALKAKRK